MSRLYLIRHGEIGSPEEKRFYGSTDLPLSEKGRQQAKRLAGRLSTERVDMIFSSPLKRALETAGVVAAAHDLQLKILPGLGEVDFGEWEGLNFEEIQTRYPSESEQWMDDPWDFTFQGGESTPDFKKRVSQALDQVLGSEGDLMIVAHGGVLRTIISGLGCIDEQEVFACQMDYAGITILELAGTKIEILSLNDTGHLS